MLNEYLKVTEIEKFSTLTSKQIRNKLVSLKNSNLYNGLIFGGGKGKGGQYKVHFTLLPIVASRIRRKKQKSIQTTNKSRLLSEYYFSKKQWN
jgi:hypothetical protein